LQQQQQQQQQKLQQKGGQEMEQGNGLHKKRNSLLGTTNNNNNNHSSYRNESESSSFRKKSKRNDDDHDDDDDDDSRSSKEPLEDFEMGASEYVTKTEAMAVYCLPEGTIAVCTIMDRKDNPHHTGWKPMILYRRREIRWWAHERYGGVVGLQRERLQRQEKKFQKELQQAKDVFK
jgi:hypothetical protein